MLAISEFSAAVEGTYADEAEEERGEHSLCSPFASEIANGDRFFDNCSCAMFSNSRSSIGLAETGGLIMLLLVEDLKNNLSS